MEKSPGHTTVYKFAVKFAAYLIKIEDRKPIAFTNIWHVDERFIHVWKSKDPRVYLLVVSDTNANIITANISFSGNIINTNIILGKAKEKAKFDPEIFVSKDLQGHKKACKKISGRRTRHIIVHFKARGIVHKG